MEQMHPVLKEIMLSETEIDIICKKVGKEITTYYENKGLKGPLVLLGLLKGCVPFMANLMKHIIVPLTTEYMVVTSYGNDSVTNGAPQILLDVNQNIENCEVLVVEDIIDSGTTLDFVRNHLLNRGAVDVKIVTLLDKFERRTTIVDVDWVGTKIADEFLVGFGLDYAQRFRNLPYVASVDLNKFDKYNWDDDFKG
jgi:hypoxanthine phosphoribosyltransferase